MGLGREAWRYLGYKYSNPNLIVWDHAAIEVASLGGSWAYRG